MTTMVTNALIHLTTDLSSLQKFQNFLLKFPSRQNLKIFQSTIFVLFDLLVSKHFGHWWPPWPRRGSHFRVTCDQRINRYHLHQKIIHPWNHLKSNNKTIDGLITMVWPRTFLLYLHLSLSVSLWYSPFLARPNKRHPHDYTRITRLSNRKSAGLEETARGMSREGRSG